MAGEHTGVEHICSTLREKNNPSLLGQVCCGRGRFPVWVVGILPVLRFMFDAPLFPQNRPLAFAPFFLLHRLFFYLVEALEAYQILYPLAGGRELLMRHARVIARLAHFL